MIDSDVATCRNSKHFEHPTVLNAPGDDHLMMFFKSVAGLCFTGPFAVLVKPRTNIDHSTPVMSSNLRQTVMSKCDFSLFDLEL